MFWGFILFFVPKLLHPGFCLRGFPPLPLRHSCHLFISMTPWVDGHTSQLLVLEGRAEQEQQLLAAPKENLRQMPRFMSIGTAGLNSAQKRPENTGFVQHVGQFCGSLNFTRDPMCVHVPLKYLWSPNLPTSQRMFWRKQKCPSTVGDMVPWTKHLILKGSPWRALADGARLWPKGVRAPEKGVKAKNESNKRIPWAYYPHPLLCKVLTEIVP